MDIIDIAQHLIELNLIKALKYRKKVPKETGFCLNCHEPLDRKFCDADCRDDYEKRRRHYAD